MKKLIATVLAASFLLIIIPACTKEPVVEKTPQERIIGKWIFDNRIENENYGGIDHISNYPGNGTDYADFRKDAKVYSDIETRVDTTSYAVTSASLINIGGLNFEIKTFTDTKFVIYRKDQFGSDYDETTISFKR
jgi:hypothetical protein